MPDSPQLQRGQLSKRDGKSKSSATRAFVLVDKESVKTEEREHRTSFDPAQMKRFYFEQEERSFVE